MCSRIWLIFNVIYWFNLDHFSVRLNMNLCNRFWIGAYHLLQLDHGWSDSTFAEFHGWKRTGTGTLERSCCRRAIVAEFCSKYQRLVSGVDHHSCWNLWHRFQHSGPGLGFKFQRQSGRVEMDGISSYMGPFVCSHSLFHWYFPGCHWLRFPRQEQFLLQNHPLSLFSTVCELQRSPGNDGRRQGSEIN